jgi:hypothetical protein
MTQTKGNLTFAPMAWTIKHFTPVINSMRLQARLFFTFNDFHPRLMFEGKAVVDPSEAKPHSYGWFLVFTTTIRLGYKWLKVTNTLAYNST